MIISVAGTIELQDVTPMVNGHYNAVVILGAAAVDIYFYGVLQVRRRATLPGEDEPTHDDDPKADGAETDHKLGFDLWHFTNCQYTRIRCARAPFARVAGSVRSPEAIHSRSSTGLT